MCSQPHEERGAEGRFSAPRFVWSVGYFTLRVMVLIGVAARSVSGRTT